MRRGKVELKRIDNTQSRQVAFSKRRKGLFKKAHELSVLCDVDLAIVVVSTSGKAYEFSAGNSINEIFERHCSKLNSQKMACGNDPKEEKHHQPECADSRNENSNVQSIKRAFEGLNFEQLNSIDIVQLEQLLNLTLRQVQYSKTQLMMKSMAVLHKKNDDVMANEEQEMMACLNSNAYDSDDDAQIQMHGL